MSVPYSCWLSDCYCTPPSNPHTIDERIQETETIVFTIGLTSILPLFVAVITTLLVPLLVVYTYIKRTRRWRKVHNRRRKRRLRRARRQHKRSHDRSRPKSPTHLSPDSHHTPTKLHASRIASWGETETSSNASLPKKSDILPPLRFTPGKAIQTPVEGIRITPAPDRGPHIIHDIVKKGPDNKLMQLSPKIRSIDPVLPPVEPVTHESDSSSSVHRSSSYGSLSSIDDHAERITVNFRDSI